MKLLLKDGTAFKGFYKQTCSVKLNRKMFYVAGGADTKSGEAVALVFLVDMEEQSVQERTSLTHARAAHGCALATQTIEDDQTGKMTNKSYLLISGGVANLKTGQAGIVPDELYDVETGTSELLATSMATPRYNHRLVALGFIIHAIGGSTLERFPVSTVERFDMANKSWSTVEKRILSESTSGLALTSVPKSLLDCHGDCKCGVGGATKIVGGGVAQVKSFT